MFELKAGMHIHLVGIGGAGLSAIARVLLGRGYKVSGSDMAANDYTAVLQQEGATVHEGHAAEQIAGADALVISSAIPDTNPEVSAANAAKLPVLKRADFLGHLMRGSLGIAVAGSHGKTTTTGMIAHIFTEAGLDPTVILGGTLPSLGANGRSGTGNFFIIEADEYDHMFLGLEPQYAIVTNVEHDHPDIYPTWDDYLAAFRQFLGLLPENGRFIACADDKGVVELLKQAPLAVEQTITYGVSPKTAQLTASNRRRNPLGGSDFVVMRRGEMIGLARLRVPGLHNVQNALAAIAVALEADIPFAKIQQALASFGGIGRRFQVTGEENGVTVIDDYAHHPTEIGVTLAAARERYPGRRLWAVWQPHTYSRTKLLLDQFATCFEKADRVVALDIYRSREKETLGMSTEVVLEAMNHPEAVYVPEKEKAAVYLLDRLLRGDVVLTLGAGDGNLVGEMVVDGLRKRG